MRTGNPSCGLRRGAVWFAAASMLAACARHRPGPDLPIPQPDPGHIRIVAAAAERLGDVQPIAVALTNGTSEAVRVDPQQIFASTDEVRVASLPPGEAARRASGARVPGALRGGTVGAATGGVAGAVGGLVSGAIQGGMGLAVAVGSAVGAGIGAITGAVGGGRSAAPDVAGFEDRALKAATLEPGFSASGYVYYPERDYHRLDVLLAEAGTGAVRSERVPIAPR